MTVMEHLDLARYNLKPTAWKFYETEGGVVYRIQFNEVPWKFKKALFEAMKDWKPGSYGWHKLSGNQIFVFDKEFKDLDDWSNWAEKFPLQITERRVWGDRERIIQHGKNRTK